MGRINGGQPPWAALHLAQPTRPGETWGVARHGYTLVILLFFYATSFLNLNCSHSARMDFAPIKFYEHTI